MAKIESNTTQAESRISPDQPRWEQKRSIMKTNRCSRKLQTINTQNGKQCSP